MATRIGMGAKRPEMKNTNGAAMKKLQAELEAASKTIEEQNKTIEEQTAKIVELEAASKK